MVLIQLSLNQQLYLYYTGVVLFIIRNIKYCHLKMYDGFVVEHLKYSQELHQLCDTKALLFANSALLNQQYFFFGLFLMSVSLHGLLLLPQIDLCVGPFLKKGFMYNDEAVCFYLSQLIPLFNFTVDLFTIRKKIIVLSLAIQEVDPVLLDKKIEDCALYVAQLEHCISMSLKMKEFFDFFFFFL